MSGRLRRRAVVIAAMATLFAAPWERLSAQDAPPPALDPDLAELAAKPDAGLVEAWVIFASQPATQISEQLRPDYERRIDSARAPALAALDRIDPLLPPRGERGALGVGGLMARERALLTDDEVASIRLAHDETKRLLSEMRSRIFAAAGPLCDAEQAPVAAWVAALPGGEVRTRTVVLDALIVRVPASSLPDLARTFPNVARITRSGKCDVSLDTSVPTIGASNWWSNGYVGGNESVAVVDTGIDASHPALTTSSSVAVVTASTVKLTYGSQASDFNDNASSADDLHGHGTHCAGTVASNDSTYAGVAPGTSLLDAKCFYLNTSGGGSANGNDIVAAVDWAISHGANVLSCSFGGPGTSDGSSGLTAYFDAVVYVSGVSVAVAAGNTGSSSTTINLPGDGFNVLTVGAFDHNATTTLSDDSLASFSSRGPTSDGRRKPDLCAPGVSIISLNNNWESGSYYASMSGTSMATPHVAGSMALLLSYLSSWQPAALKALLDNSCRNASPVSGTPDSNWGCGALDLGQAYSDRTRVVTATMTSSGATAHYYKLGSVSSGARQTVAWTRAASYASGTNPASGPGSVSPLVNFDLYLYDGSNGSQAAASASTVDSVEQTAASSAITSGVLKVLRSGSFPSGQTSQSYSLATGANTATAANPPALVFTATSAPAAVAGSTQFTFTATVKNTGDLRAPSPALTLTLPSGFSFASGYQATQSVSSLDPFATAGATQTASWTVVSGTSNGSFTLSVAGSTTCYGATFTSSSSTRSITVDASPPTANAGSNISVFATSSAGKSITLDGSASTDNNAAQGLTYAWDTNGDGNFADAGGSATGVSPTVLFPIGTRTVTLRVTDFVGNVGTASISVQVKDNPPVANAGSNRSGNEGSSISFDATASSDVEGAIASYSWNFGDGSAAGTGATPTHTYTHFGSYTATLTVTDSAGQTGTATTSVTVANVAPSANAGPSKSGNEGSSITFAGSGSDAGSGDTLTYSWNFGDGTSPGSGATPSHTYTHFGSYTATLTVTDDGGLSSQSTTSVTVANVAPSANAGSAKSGDEGASISFAGAGGDAGAGDTLTYAWDFGDGGTAGGASASHVYVRFGTYTATLTVADDGGLLATSTTQVTVRDVAPVAVAGADASSNEGDAVDFAGSATDAGSGDVLTYSWDFGDGGTASTAAASHVYAQDGVYVATLTATDDGGLSGVSMRTITVANVPPDVALPDAVDVVVGSTLQLHLAPTDPSPVDAANLVVAWKIVDAADAVVVSGQGVDVTWPADRKLSGRLVVDVTDDHATTERSAPLVSGTPTIGDTVVSTLAQNLSAAVERQVFLDVFAARASTGSPKKLKTAGAKFAAAQKLLAKNGVTSGSLVAQLVALAGDCNAGAEPPAETPFVAPGTLGTISDLLDAAPRAGFAANSSAKLLSTLVALRYDLRLGAAKKIKSAKKAASAAAAKLPAGALRDWFANSIAAQ